MREADSRVGIRILISGYYGFGNTGDEMILAGMLADLKEQIPEAGFTVISGDPAQTGRLHSVDTLHWTDLPGMDEAAASADLVILGGGGILHDSHHFQLNPDNLLTPSHSGLSYYASVPLLAAIHGVPCMLYAAGIGPLQSQAARDLSTAILDLCDVATVRDQGSLTCFVDSCAPTTDLLEKIHVAADPAFSFRFREDFKPPDLPADLHGGPGKVLGVSLRHWEFGQAQENWEREVAAALDILVREDQFRVLFVPFQVLQETVYENDLRVSLRVQDLMEEKDHAAAAGGLRSFEDVAWMLEQCDAVLGMRYHSVLLGLKSGKPVSAFGYDPKVRSIMVEFGRGEQVLDQPWVRDAIVSTVRGSMHGESDGAAARLRERAHSSAGMAADLLSGRDQGQGKLRQGEKIRPGDALIRDLLQRKTIRVHGLQQHYDSLQQQQGSLQQQYDSLQQVLASREEELTRKTEDLRQQVQQAERQRTVIRDLQSDRDWLAAEREHLTRELHEIHHSRYWHVLSLYWCTRERFHRFWQRIRRSVRFSPVWEGMRKVSLKVSSLSTPVKQEWRSGSEALPCNCSPGQIRFQPDVIILPIIDWEFRFQRPQQLARQAAAHGQRVFYARTTLNPAGLQVSDVEENVYQVQLPGPGNLNLYRDVMKDEDAKQILAGFEQLAFEMGITEAVCMVQLPFWTPLALKLRERFGWLLVYDCMDDHAGFSTNTMEAGQEEQLLRECDLALATSQVLYDRAEALAPKTLLLPNAADFDHFVQAGVRPDDFPETHGPVIGYVGAVSDWFDFALLEPAVEAHPDWTFVFVGSTWGADGHRNLARRPNVHFLGEKPYEEIPAYLHEFDCCVIPFKETRLTRATNPVKLYEYLAAGKPVVARRLPELEPFEGQVLLADNAEQFLQGLEQALQDDSRERASERKELMRSQTWEARFDLLHAGISSLFGSVSVVIITWNNLDLTRKCLESLLCSTSHPDLEVILVDNASEDGTQDALREYAAADQRIQLILNDTNRGFGPALNQGLGAAGGDYLAVLNNDVILTPGWLSVLVSRLRQDPSIGMIGPMSNGAWNEALVKGEYSSDTGMMAFARERASRYAGSLAPIKMLAMYCVVLPRKVLDSVGMMDEQFGIGMFEDDDFALRIRKAGWRIAAALDVYIHHQSRSSFKLIGKEAYQAIFSRNRAYFEEKWKLSWKPHVSRALVPDGLLYSMLERILSASDAGRRVVLFPGVKEGQPGFEENLELAETLRDSGAVVFFVDPEAQSGRIEMYREGIFCAEVPLVVFDAVQSPVVVAGLEFREVALNLRSPRIVYDLRFLEALDARQVLSSAGAGVIEEAAAVLVATEEQRERLEKTYEKVRIYCGSLPLCDIIQLPDSPEI